MQPTGIAYWNLKPWPLEKGLSNYHSFSQCAVMKSEVFSVEFLVSFVNFTKNKKKTKHIFSDELFKFFHLICVFPYHEFQVSV